MTRDGYATRHPRCEEDDMRVQKWIPIVLAMSGLTPAAALAQATQHQGEQATQHQGEQAQQHQRREVSLNSVPDPVRETIRKQAEGGQVLKVSQTDQNGKTYYEAWIQKGKDRFASVMDPSGKVVRYEQPEQQKKAEAKSQNGHKGTGGGPAGTTHSNQNKNQNKNQNDDGAKGTKGGSPSGSDSNPQGGQKGTENP
jgi:hypothetical protein